MDANELAQASADSLYADDIAARELGIDIDRVGPGAADARMTVTAQMANGHAICHGGYVFALADTAFAYACNSYGQVTVAAGATIDFVRSAQVGDELTAEAREVRRGKRSGVYDVRVIDGAGRLIALFRGRSASLGKAITIDSK